MKLMWLLHREPTSWGMVKRAFILETLSFTHSDNSATEPPLIVTLARVVI